MRYTPKTGFGLRLREDRRYRVVTFAIGGFGFNILYALYNGAPGIASRSWWFLSLCAYYALLSSMRLGVIMQDRRNIASERFISGFCGVMLMALALVLAGTVYLSLTMDIAVRRQEIMMITVATYTFYKITLAIINIIKVRKEKSLLMTVIRNIGCADAAVSVLSLQRSMLVSFGAMEHDGIYRMNALTGAGVFLTVMLLGINLTVKSVKKDN